MLAANGGEDESQDECSLSLSLSLSVPLLLLGVTAAEAVKVTLEKEPVFSDRGGLVGHRDVDPALLADLRVTLLADYPTYLAGEVAEADLERFQRLAVDRALLTSVRRDWDLVRVNGYVFTSQGEPTGVPPELLVTRYEGALALCLVQLEAPLTPEWQAALARAGTVVAYFPENTFLVRSPSQDMERLRELNGVQHVSLFQPAYKVHRSLLDAAEALPVSLELDAGQDLAVAQAFVQTLTSQPLQVRGIGRFAYAHASLSRSQIVALARRPEVLWLEPTMVAELSGEREACVVAGQVDPAGLRPLRYPGDPGGHQDWLRSKGFCTPTVADPGCMVYWTKVGVVDSGLDLTKCLAYNPETGVCSQWDASNRRHPDLDHTSNIDEGGPCPPEGVAGIEGVEGNPDCVGPVIVNRFFCGGSAAGYPCYVVPQGPPYPPPVPYWDFSDTAYVGYGHGTAVASIIVGNPLHGEPQPPSTDSEGFLRGSGIAPSAQVVVARFDELAVGPGGGVGMRDSDYSHLVRKVTARGARFLTNSFNVYAEYDGRPGTQYTLFSKTADLLVRDADGEWGGELTQTTLVFSAGNLRRVYPNPWPQGWTLSPANAKNVIAASASRGWFESGGAPHPTCPVEPTDPHYVRDIVGGEILNIEEGHSWHSRRAYPGEPGSAGNLPRFKPDLVAPGTYVAAARTRWHIPVPDEPYLCFGGTSAAAPAVAGAAILAEAWYYYQIGGVLPSPAMVRAMLVAHAEDLAGGTDHFPPGATPPSPTTLPHSPSIAQGWGRVDLDGLLQEQVPVVALDQDHGSAGRRFTASGQWWSAQLQVADPGQDVLAVMVFTDAPSEVPAVDLKVNDLDLRVFKISLVPGGGRQYWGNHFATNSWYSRDTAGQILPSLPEDRHNTVEVIRVPAGELIGTFVVRVKATTVVAKAVPGLDGGPSIPNQDFALYVFNAFPVQE